MDDRGVNFEGQIADSSVQLLTSLINVVHEFTATSSLSPLQQWFVALDKELEFAAMTKHSVHIREIKNLLQGLFLNNVLQNLNNYLSRYQFLRETIWAYP